MVSHLIMSLALLAPADDSVVSDPPEHVRPVLHAITVEPGASCLDADKIASKVITALGQPEVDSRIDVQIVGDPTSAGEVRFEIRKRQVLAAERDFAFDLEATCDEKHAVVGVAVALAIDATLVEEGDGPPIVVPMGPEPAPAPPKRSGGRRQSPKSPDPVATTKWSVRVTVSGGLSVEAPPKLGAFGDLAVDFGWLDTVDLVVGALAGSSGSQDVGDGTAVLTVVGGRGAVCGGYRWRMLRPRACAGMILGAALAGGRGFAEDRRSQVPWLAPTLGGDLRVEVAPRVELELGADAVFHAVRPAFDFLDEGQTRTLGVEFPRVGAFVGFGVVIAVR